MQHVTTVTTLIFARAIYVVATNKHLSFVKSNGQWRFSRDFFNDRDQQDTRSKYKAIFKMKGYILGARNEVVVKATALGSDDYTIVGGAHLLEAIQDCWQEEYDSNEQVRASIDGGIKVTEIDYRSPPDIVKYFKEESNSLNGIASKTSFIETYNMMEDVESAWKQHRNSQRDSTAPIEDN